MKGIPEDAVQLDVTITPEIYLENYSNTTFIFNASVTNHNLTGIIPGMLTDPSNPNSTKYTGNMTIYLQIRLSKNSRTTTIIRNGSLASTSTSTHRVFTDDQSFYEEFKIPEIGEIGNFTFNFTILPIITGEENMTYQLALYCSVSLKEIASTEGGGHSGVVDQEGGSEGGIGMEIIVTYEDRSIPWVNTVLARYQYVTDFYPKETVFFARESFQDFESKLKILEEYVETANNYSLDPQANVEGYQLKWWFEHRFQGIKHTLQTMKECLEQNYYERALESYIDLTEAINDLGSLIEEYEEQQLQEKENVNVNDPDVPISEEEATVGSEPEPEIVDPEPEPELISEPEPEQKSEPMSELEPESDPKQGPKKRTILGFIFLAIALGLVIVVLLRVRT